MKRERHTLAVRFNKRAAKMLLDFVNSHADGFERFKRRWERPDNLQWPGLANDFLNTQRIVRDVWEGKKAGFEDRQLDASLGLDDLLLKPPPIHADWKAGELFLAPRDLRDLVWLTLLQHAARLAICDNKDGGCPTPYFLKQKRRQRFCSDACAQPAQREFKRRWWAEYGEQWRQERRKKKKRRRSSKRK